MSMSVPEEDWIVGQHVPEPNQLPQRAQDSGSNYTEDEILFRKISEKIVGGDSDISDLENLPPGRRKNILCAVDQYGRNFVLICVVHRNIVAFRKVLDLFRQWALDDCLHKSFDKDDNNVLQLAFISDDSNLVDMVWHYVSQLDENLIADLVTHLNFDDANALSIALGSKKGHAWIVNLILPVLQLSESNVLGLISPDKAGVNAIEKAVVAENFECAIALVNIILKGTNKTAVLQSLRALYSKHPNYQQPSNRDIGAGNANDDAEAETTRDELFVEKLVRMRNGSNDEEIDQLIMLFAVESFNITYDETEVTNHFRALTLPLYEGMQCLLSTFIMNNCYIIINKLLRTIGFRKHFWDQFEESDGPFNREKLEGHAMDSRLIALFNAPPSKTYLNLSNTQQAKPQAILAFTEMHTPNSKLSYRTGATEECYKLKEALQNKLRYNCHIFSGEQKCWRKSEFIDWFVERLEEIKEITSTLFIAVFAHGEEGIVFDSDKEPIAIGEIVALANKHMYPGIPITFFIQACRNRPAIGKPPSLGLKRHNVLLRSCSEGEGSIRSVYANKMADCINNGSGLLDVIETHHTVAEHIVEHHDTNIQQQTPQISHLGKRKFPLGNCS